jgi:hypothetical protein
MEICGRLSNLRSTEETMGYDINVVKSICLSISVESQFNLS